MNLLQNKDPVSKDGLKTKRHLSSAKKGREARGAGQKEHGKSTRRVPNNGVQVDRGTRSIFCILDLRYCGQTVEDCAAILRAR